MEPGILWRGKAESVNTWHVKQQKKKKLDTPLPFFLPFFSWFQHLDDRQKTKKPIQMGHQNDSDTMIKQFLKNLYDKEGYVKF